MEIIQYASSRLTRKFKVLHAQVSGVKSDTTSNDTVHSLGDMLICLVLSRNCWELNMRCSDPAMSRGGGQVSITTVCIKGNAPLISSTL